jgi:hypothetical protein
MFRTIVSVLILTSPSMSLGHATAQPIPRTQFIGDMDTQFRKMDADKNGLLTRVEIEQCQKLTAVAEAQARNRALFDRLDTDKDGIVTPAEMKAGGIIT